VENSQQEVLWGGWLVAVSSTIVTLSTALEGKTAEASPTEH